MTCFVCSRAESYLTAPRTKRYLYGHMIYTCTESGGLYSQGATLTKECDLEMNILHFWVFSQVVMVHIQAV